MASRLAPDLDRVPFARDGIPGVPTLAEQFWQWRVNQCKNWLGRVTGGRIPRRDSRVLVDHAVPLAGPFGVRVTSVLTDPRLDERGILNAVRVREILDEHAARRADHTKLLWTLFGFELWCRQFFDGEREGREVHDPLASPCTLRGRSVPILRVSRGTEWYNANISRNEPFATAPQEYAEMRMKSSLFAASLLVLTCSSVFAATYTVNASGSGDYPTIQHAILFMVAGDELLLEDGTYTGAGNRAIQTTGVDIRIASINGPDDCIIDCEGIAQGFVIFSGETQATVIEGITVMDGWAAPFPGSEGGGIFISNASPTIRNCVLRMNLADSGGGLAVNGNSSPLIEDCLFDQNLGDFGAGAYLAGLTNTLIRCRFTGNIADARGGGFYGTGGGRTVSIEECEFIGNQAPNGAAGYSTFAVTTITGSVVCDNVASSTGGAFHFQRESHTISNSTISGNTAVSSGSCVQVRDFASLSISNSILAFGVGSNAAKCANGGSISLSCTDVYGNAGGDYVDCLAGQENANDNLSADPAFCDAGSKDFALASNSPCAPAQSPVCGQIGAFDVGCGGTTATEQTSWGEVKQLFR